MTMGCNIWMVCLKLNWFFYGLSRMLNFSEFVWTVSYSVWDVFTKFLLIDTTDRSKISSDQKRFFIALSLYPISFFANTPFKIKKTVRSFSWIILIEVWRIPNCESDMTLFNWIVTCYYVYGLFKGYNGCLIITPFYPGC